MNHEPKKQSQTKPNKLEANLPPKGAEIPTGELLGILKPGPKQTQFIVSLPNLLVVSLPAMSKPVPSALVLIVVEGVEGVEVSNLQRGFGCIGLCFCRYFQLLRSIFAPFPCWIKGM